MQESIQKSIDVLTSKWESFNLKQKIQIISIGVALILALGLTVYMTTKPKMKVLAENQSTTTIYNIKKALSDANIKGQIEQGETAISVSEKDYETAKGIIIESGVTDDSFSFADALNAMSMGTTADVKRSIQNREMEARIEKNLSSIQGIEKAEVNVVPLNDTNHFIETKQEASAGITLTLSRELSEEQVDAVARRVKASVNGLDKKNIEIIDDKSNILYSGEENSNGTFNSQRKYELQKKIEIEKTAKQAMAKQFSDVKVMSNIVFDWDTHTETEKIYSTPNDSTKGIPTEQKTSTSTYTNTPNAEEPGFNGNGGDITNYQTGGAAGSEAKSEEKDIKYALNEKNVVTEKQTGIMNSDLSSLSMFAYREITYDQAELEARGELDNISWIQYQEQIQPTVFQVDDILITSISNGIGIPIKNLSVVGIEVPKFIDKPIINRPIDQYIMLTILVLLIALLAFGLIRRTAPAEVTEIEPELSVEEVLETFSKRQEYVSPIDYESESEVKKQIEKFVDQRPESVAQLLRNWLSSDWE